MKRNLINIAIITLAGILVGAMVFSDTEAGVTATVTARKIALTVSDGSIAYGSLDLGTSTSTLAAGLDDMQTVTNIGSVAEDFNVKGTSTADWTLAGSIDTDQYKHEFSTSTGSDWTALTTNYQPSNSDVASNATTSLDLQITVPSDTTHFGVQNPNVTVQSVMH
jgi:hypothetical protein